MRPNKADRVIDDLKWDPIGDFDKISDALAGKTVYVDGDVPIDPFELEPADTQHQIEISRPSRSRTWEMVTEIKHWFAAYQANPESTPKGYMTDIQGEVVRIHFDRIDDDEELLEIIVPLHGPDLDRLRDHPAVEVTEVDEE